MALLVDFVVKGAPQGKARPRFNRYSGTAYTPSRTRDKEREAAMIAKAAMHGCYPASEPLRVEIEAFFEIPKSATKKEKFAMMTNRMRPTKKPDADNIAKLILDAMNGIVYRDDKYVVEVEVKKYYSYSEGHVDVSVYTTDDDKESETAL